MKLNKTHNDLPQKVRADVAALLNQLLANAGDFHSQAKQAHWNVKGPAFLQLHQLFDKVAGEAEDWADELAERAVQLGSVALGTVRMTARATQLVEFPDGAVSGEKAVAALTEALASFSKAIRTAIEEAARLGDADTADLFTEISRGADKLLWMLEAHLQEPPN